MIVFDLECFKGHIFEGWFNDLPSFEAQNARKLVSCPYCNTTRVRRIMSPVAMKSSSRADEEKAQTAIDYSKLAREVVDYIHKNFDDVGPNFTKEALKMHFGVAEKRNIRGSATEQEEKTLREEKIDFFRLPIPKVEDDKKN